MGQLDSQWMLQGATGHCAGAPCGFSHGSKPRALTFASLCQVNLASSQPQIDQTGLTPSSVSQKTVNLPPGIPPTAHPAINPQPQTMLFRHQQHLPMTWLPSVPTSNYQSLTSTDHRTTMHRQQNPPNVPVIKLGELVGSGRDFSWGRSDYRNTALLRLYRVSVASQRGGRTCLIGWETWILIPWCHFPFIFFAFHQSSLPLSCSFEHTATLPIYYQTPPTLSSLGYMMPVDADKVLKHMY